VKILILTHSYPDDNNRWRGSFVREQALALSCLHEVTVVFFKVDYSHFAPFGKYMFSKQSSVNLIEYEVTISKSFPVINQVKYFHNTYRFMKNQILKTFTPDIIHSHLSYPAGFFGTVIQKILGIPNIITEHSWIRKHFRSFVHKKCILYALRNSAGIITVSNTLREDLKTFCSQQIYVVPNVINFEGLNIGSRIKNKVFNIGILGGMGNYRKGLDILIDAVARLKGIDIFMHIGGTGQLLETFKKQAVDSGIYDKCRFYGEVSKSDLQKFYSELDTFVLASRDETFGVVIVEAMACGLPVIATDCGGPAEIISEETGVLVEKENPEKLAEAIRYMAVNLHRYNPGKIRKFALDKYGYDAFNRRMSELYRILVKA
jgi:L-malate glycosyltransferase